MPRNGSGTYTLPTGNPVVSGTIIESTWANSTLADLADAITNSLARNGEGGMTAPLRLTDGVVATPSLAFANETGSGLYRAAAGDVGLTVLGSRILRLQAAGASVTGTLGVSGDTSLTNLAYTGTLTGGTGVINIGSGQLVKDAAGNLGLGVTPSAWYTGFSGFDIGTKGALSGANGGAILWANCYLNASAQVIRKSTGYTARYVAAADVGQHIWLVGPYAASGGGVVSETQAMTLTAAGRLLIGTTSGGGTTPQYPLSLGVGTGRKLAVYDDGSSAGVASGFGIDMGGSAYELSAWVGTSGGGNGTFTWGQVNTTTNTFSEKMRLDSSGNLLVGTTSQPNASFPGRFVVSGGGIKAASFQVNSTSAAGQIEFYNPNGSVGLISTSGSTTTYSTSSDYRLKENVEPMTGALAKVAALKPCTYTWKSDGSAGQGFIAHELQEVVPDCVTGEKDAVDADGNPKYQGVDTSFLVATLVAAIQELKAEVDALKAAA